MTRDPLTPDEQKLVDSGQYVLVTNEAGGQSLVSSMDRPGYNWPSSNFFRQLPHPMLAQRQATPLPPAFLTKPEIKK